MSSETLATYLNDHLAGSVAAVEMLGHLAELRRGTEQEGLFLELRTEVEQDQTVLRQMLGALGEKESRTRKAAAWITEKLGRVKLRLDDPGDGELQVLEALETLGLGIQGKLALWRSLVAVADLNPQLRVLDFGRLEQRALAQYQRVESERVRAARIALAP
jgi:hypothetical protein